MVISREEFETLVDLVSGANQAVVLSILQSNKDKAFTLKEICDFAKGRVNSKTSLVQTVSNTLRKLRQKKIIIQKSGFYIIANPKVGSIESKTSEEISDKVLTV